MRINVIARVRGTIRIRVRGRKLKLMNNRRRNLANYTAVQCVFRNGRCSSSGAILLPGVLPRVARADRTLRLRRYNLDRLTIYLYAQIIELFSLWDRSSARMGWYLRLDDEELLAISGDCYSPAFLRRHCRRDYHNCDQTPYGSFAHVAPT